MAVLSRSTPLALWREIIHEAEVSCSTLLPEDLESYLIFMLMRYMDRPDMVKKIMASQWLHALNDKSKQRDILFQEVGDSCLLFSGLFPNVAQKRLVKISYFVNMGRGAYVAISKENDDVYSALAQQFVSLMDVLQSVRKYSDDCPDLQPLQAYDLWNETGSLRALKVLRESTNGIPIANPHLKFK